MSTSPLTQYALCFYFLHSACPAGCRCGVLSDHDRHKHYTLRFEFGRPSSVPAIKSRNIVQAHQSEACWENESPLKLSMITVQQESREKFLKSDEMSPSIIVSRLVDS